MREIISSHFADQANSSLTIGNRVRSLTQSIQEFLNDRSDVIEDPISVLDTIMADVDCEKNKGKILTKVKTELIKRMQDSSNNKLDGDGDVKMENADTVITDISLGSKRKRDKEEKSVEDEPDAKRARLKEENESIRELDSSFYKSYEIIEELIDNEDEIPDSESLGPYNDYVSEVNKQGVFEKISDKEKSRYYMCLGHIKFADKNYNEAKPYYKKANELDNQHPIFINHIGLCFDRLGDEKEALKYYLAAVKLDNGVARYHRNVGLSYYYLDNDKKAIESYLQALKLYKAEDTHYIRDYSIYLHLGNCYFNLADFEKARDSYLKEIELNSNSKKLLNKANCYESLGDSYKALKDHQAAIESYKMAISLYPRKDKFNEKLLKYCKDSDADHEPHRQDLISFYKEEISKNENNSSLYYKPLFWLLGRNSDNDQELIDICKDAITNHPKNPIFYNYLGMACLRTLSKEDNNYEQKKQDIEKNLLEAIKLDQENSSFLASMGLYYYFLEFYMNEKNFTEKSIEYFKKAISKNKENSEIYLYLAEIHSVLSNDKEATDNYLQYILFDNNPGYKNYFYPSHQCFYTEFYIPDMPSKDLIGNSLEKVSDYVISQDDKDFAESVYKILKKSHLHNSKTIKNIIDLFDNKIFKKNNDYFPSYCWESDEELEYNEKKPYLENLAKLTKGERGYHYLTEYLKCEGSIPTLSQMAFYTMINDAEETIKYFKHISRLKTSNEELSKYEQLIKETIALYNTGEDIDIFNNLDKLSVLYEIVSEATKKFSKNEEQNSNSNAISISARAYTEIASISASKEFDEFDNIGIG